MAIVKFKYKGEPVELDVNLRGKPRAGETTEDANARRIADAKKAFKKANP